MSRANRSRSQTLAGLLALSSLAASLVPGAAFAVGEQNARLRGTVVEKGSNVALPGAKITIKGEMGAPRVMTTDENGAFDFPSIPGGAYTVLIEYEGLRPIKRKVRLDLGETVNLPIAYSAELAASETTTIVEERRRIDTDKVSTGKVLSADSQAKIATGRSYQSIVSQLPGVASPGGGNPIMAGGTTRHNRYLVDGLDITDPVTNTFSANFNFDAIAQVDTQLLAVDAQYNSLGGVLNLITKRGSDKFHIDASFYFNHQGLSAGARAGTQIFEGPLADQSDPRPPTAGYQGNLNVSGPLIKQKLYFYLSTEVRYTLRSVVPGPPLNTQHVSRTFLGIYPRIKLTYQPATRHRVELSVSADPTLIRNLEQANTFANEAEYHQNQGGVFGVLNYDWFAKDNLIVGVQTGLQLNRLDISPASGDLDSSQRFDRASTVRWNAGRSARSQDDQRWRFQFDPTVTWIKKGWLGEHTMKVGAQLAFLRQYRYLATPGNSVFTDDTNQMGDRGVLVRDPTSTERPFGCNPLASISRPEANPTATPCYQLTTYDPAMVQVRQAFGIGGFVQDTWKPTRWLTIVPGMRIDYGISKNSQGETAQNLLGFGPRLGMNLDLTRDGKTVLKVAYGRANEVLSLYSASAADATPLNSTWAWNRTSRRFDRFFGSSGGKDGYDLSGRCADGENAGRATADCGNAKLSLTPPRADFFTASLEREVVANVSVGVTYTVRHLSFMWDDIELNAQHTLDGGDYAAYGDKRYGSVFGYRPTKESFRTYQGIDFVLSGSPSPNWNFFVAYTLAWLYGTNDDQVTLFRDDPPRDFRFYGYLAEDRRHQLKANGSYTWRGLTVGANLSYLSGAPTTRLYLQAIDYIGRYGWRGVDPNADPNDVRKWTELRLPDQMALDIRVQFDVFEGIRSRMGNQHLSIIADLLNTLNLLTPTGLENRNTPTYGVVTNRLSPFQAQLALRYQY